jgi:hypothetical protein
MCDRGQTGGWVEAATAAINSQEQPERLPDDSGRKEVEDRRACYVAIGIPICRQQAQHFEFKGP